MTDREPSRAGTIAGLAVRDARRAPMRRVDHVVVTVEAGLDGDHKGRRFPNRQVTLLAIEDWEAACADLAVTGLDWTERRANILTRGLRLPRAKGARLWLGHPAAWEIEGAATGITLEVTGQTVPCRRMDEALCGLRKALAPAWRGGVTARVLTGGSLAIGDLVVITHAPAERSRRLP